MAIKFVSNTQRMTKGKERRQSNLRAAVLHSFIMLKLGSDRCQLPSCSRELDSRFCQKHHRDYRGKAAEDPFLYPRVIHLFCPSSCHDRVHKIAGAIICYLETHIATKTDLLVPKIVNLLREKFKNVRFVLDKELRPNGLVEIKKGYAMLKNLEDPRIRRIKKYLKMNNPELLAKLISV